MVGLQAGIYVTNRKAGRTRPCQLQFNTLRGWFSLSAQTEIQLSRKTPLEISGATLALFSLLSEKFARI
jgi:hypothetical protein